MTDAEPLVLLVIVLPLALALTVSVRSVIRLRRPDDRRAKARPRP